jgi:hypothetical protein
MKKSGVLHISLIISWLPKDVTYSQKKVGKIMNQKTYCFLSKNINICSKIIIPYLKLFSITFPSLENTVNFSEILFSLFETSLEVSICNTFLIIDKILSFRNSLIIFQ